MNVRACVVVCCVGLMGALSGCSDDGGGGGASGNNAAQTNSGTTSTNNSSTGTSNGTSTSTNNATTAQDAGQDVSDPDDAGPTEDIGPDTSPEDASLEDAPPNEDTSPGWDSSGGDIPDVDPVEGDLVAYVGPGAATEWKALHRLSDGTLLIGGQARSLEWVPEGVPVQELALETDSASEGNIGVMLHVSPDAARLLRVVHLPAGTARDIQRIRSTEVPGELTGTLYISGNRDVNNTERDGYFIARLEGNFVDGPPTGVAWTHDVICEPRRAGGFQGQSAFKQIQPWDVGADGRVVYGRGAEYDFDWAQLSALNADGTDAVLEHWTAHWTESDGEFYGPASEAPSAVLRSGVVLKSGRRGSLRSLTQADFDMVQPDGNGRDDRPGRFPDDYFFSGPCIVGGDCPGGPGYTGYRTSDKPTQRLGGVTIDRRTGAMYFGISTQSVLPGGNPDFEPALVAMDRDGQLMWWNRLYEETDDNSTPDQYVDAVEVDYAQGRVVVLGRAHGNNVVNLWSGNTIAARPDATGFQNRFTGTSGNIHISWLGAFALDTGTLQASTFVAEFSEGLQGAQAFSDDHPLLAGQPNPNAGWPDLNTTRCRNTLAIDPAGHVAVACTGRRTLTTSNAYQQMEPVGGGVGTWNQFVRVYTPDLSGVVYSTLLTGDWDRETGQGGGNTHIASPLLVPGGVVVVGHHEEDEDNPGTARGVPVPVSGTLPWGAQAPEGQTGLLGRFAIPTSSE